MVLRHGYSTAALALRAHTVQPIPQVVASRYALPNNATSMMKHPARD